MSATNQFPPPHLISEEDEQSAREGGAAPPKKVGEAERAEQQQQQQERLALPSAPANEEKARQLDVAEGGRVKLDELGPMVVSCAPRPFPLISLLLTAPLTLSHRYLSQVNKDGTLSRIHNWAAMTEGERERTLRVLGKRNQVRMADIRGAGEEQSEEKRE